MLFFVYGICFCHAAGVNVCRDSFIKSIDPRKQITVFKNAI
jgi:hypothetical protein